MKILKKTISAATSGAILLGLSTISANALTTDNLTDHYGKVVMNIKSPRPIHVKIEKYSKNEGVLTYYEGDYNGTVDFDLDSCEYVGRKYDSYYNIIFTDNIDKKSTYTTDSVVIYDGGFNNQPKSTQLNYSVNITEGDKRSVDFKSESAVNEEEGDMIQNFTLDMTVVSMPGDVNGDEKIDAKDATAILVDYANRIYGNESTIPLELGDYNYDGVVDAKDATAILVYYANLIYENM